LALAGRLDLGQQIGQRKAQPGDDHGPGLDAAQAVDALLLREAGREQVFDAEGQG
jgi:hypothetical protein